MDCIDLKLQFNSKHLQQLIEILTTAGKARLIGGCVRDKILNYPVTDVDIATSLLPEQVVRLCNKHNVKTIPTGIEYGTITVIIENEKFEVTTLRKDIECYGRRVKVEYTDDFALDAARRDFTINALSYDLKKQKIYDYFNGLQDLKDSKVTFIGDASERIKEDYLRILRFFRFSARYTDKIDEVSYKATVEHKSGLKLLSRERILSELDNLFVVPNHLLALEAMDQGNFFHEIDHRIIVDIKAITSLKKASQKIGTVPTLGTKYALLFNPTAKDNLKDILQGLRMPTRRIKDILELTESSSCNLEGLYKLWFKDTLLFEQIVLYLTVLNHIAEDKAISLLQSFKSYSPNEFPISGDILQELGYKGILIKEAIEYLRVKWVESNFSLEQSELIKLLKNK
ncbi:MAG: pcnB [Rickettsiaceae bacterium]|jgi:poly(A) polymerase|nr:pcnB [Rickettsiaceae bacterium]